jgi:flagellar motor switch protein FliN/FliY
MTSILDETARHFATAFSGALAQVLSKHTTVSWTVAEDPNAQIASAPDQAQIYQMTLQGSLSGECFVELARSDLPGIAAAMRREAAGELTPEPAETFREILTAAGNELAVSLASRHGLVTVRTQTVTDDPLQGACIISLLASRGATERVSLRLSLGQSLLESLQTGGKTPTVWPQPAPTPAQEKSNDPNLHLVLDVELNVTLRFGQRTLPLRDVLELSTGSVIELDRQVEEPVELLLDGRVIARGEAVIVDGNYGLRVTEVPGGPALLAQ